MMMKIHLTPIQLSKIGHKVLLINLDLKIKDVQGISDNAQYLLALEPIIIRTFKLFPCWSAIMRQHFGFGEETASSSRIECFNHIKNRVFKNSHLPLRVDSFIEELILYYRGDHLLLQGKNDNNMIKSHDQRSHSNNDNNTYDNQNNVSLSHSINNDNLMACEDDFLIISDTNFMNQNDVSLSRSNTENGLNTYSYDNELFDNFKSNEHSDATANSTDDSSLSSCISNDVNEHHIYNKSSIVNTELKNIQCQPCRNGDIPTGLHKCIQCKKAVHLFGCSIRIPNTDEGCGEPRICLDCDKKNSTIAENKATESWNRKRKLQNSQSSRSYLVRQPGFELLDLIKKGNITSVILLKNGNSLLSKPIMVPDHGKLIISNTFSVDSILSLLATSAADSGVYRKYLSDLSSSNLTSNIALQMITEKKVRQMWS